MSIFSHKNIFIIKSLLIGVLSSGQVYAQQQQTIDRNMWLKERFGAQHQALLPIVAVADMLHGCQQKNQVENHKSVTLLITELDKNTLASQLITCLNGQSLKGDVALNYGLKSCFYEQFKGMSLADKQQKMMLVDMAIKELSRSERQESFTQCVTDQAIAYLR